MSSVLHPVGPEPASTYWLRRALVVGVLAVLVAIVAALIPNGDAPRQAVPAPAPSTTAPMDATPSPTVAPATPTLTPGSSATSSATATRSSSPKSTASATSTPSAKSNPTKDSSAKKTTPPPKATEPELCDPSDLRATLTGKPRLRVKESNTFNLSMINGSKKTCRVSVTTEIFELKIDSGKDKIWTSGDCSSAVKSIDRNVASQKAAVWRMTWNGRRSAPGCKTLKEIPKPGTYVATASLADVKPVTFRMTLTG